MTERSLRIAIFGESYLPYLSGVTVSTEALARGLGAAGHDVLLVAPRPAHGATPGTAGAQGPEPRVAWLPSFQVPGPAPAGYRVPWPIPSAALRAAAAFAPEIVHAQSPFVSGLMARRVARHAGAPLVFTHHTRFGDYRHYLGAAAGPGGALVADYLRRYWLGCAAVVAPGSELADEIRAGIGARRRPDVRVIPTGIEVAALRALEPIDPRPLAGWPADAVVVAGLGRLAPEKSVELLVDAFAAVAADEPAARLLLVGGGPSEAALRRRAERPDLAGRVHLTGMRPRQEALALVKAADLLATASRTETQGLVLAEALAAGLPVVALSGPGVADSVRDGVDGLVVPAEPADERRIAPGERDPHPGPRWRTAGPAGRRGRRGRGPIQRGRAHRDHGRPVPRAGPPSRDEPDAPNGCAGEAAAYNADHARESDGPLRLPPRHRLRSEARSRPTHSAGARQHAPDLPPVALGPPSRADDRRPPFADEPVSLPFGRQRWPRQPAPRHPAARASARPSRIAARVAALRTVRATSAGGVVHRVDLGSPQIVLVHRRVPPLWALPKGTPDSGETLAETAIRETREESGLEVEIEEPITANHLLLRARVARATTRPSTSS